MIRARRYTRRSTLTLGAAVLVGLWQLASSGPSLAGPSPEAVIRSLVNEALEILRDEELAKDSKRRMQRLRQAVDKAFNWDAMARSSLGHHWRKLSDTQRAEFVSVFRELLARQYQNDLDRFQGTEQVEIKGTRADGPLRVVDTVLVTASKEKVPINYTLRDAGPGYRVEDFSIEGVSLVKHYRKSFDRFLVNQSFEALLERLRRRLGRS